MAEDVLFDIRGLTKTYDDTVALDNVSFSIRSGEIFGVLGRNGAGKTTLIEILEGIHRPDRGFVHVGEWEDIYDNREYKKWMGVQLQRSATNDNMYVREILKLFAYFYATPAGKAVSVANRLGLRDRLHTRYKDLSGGEKQALQLVLTFFHEPRIVFLDEPTTGLDPIARRKFWDFVRERQRSGRTVIMTTHYVEEAEKLCDRVAVMANGRIVALDSPENLIAKSPYRHKVVLEAERAVVDPDDFDHPVKVDKRNGEVWIFTSAYKKTMEALIHFADQRGWNIGEMSLHRITLEDIFIEILGWQK